MNKHTTFLFDFDYTLANSDQGIILCFQYVLNRNGFRRVTDEQIKRVIGMSVEKAFTALTGITNIDTLIYFKKQYLEKADEIMTDNTLVYPEAITTLQILKENNKKTGIVTTKARYRVEEVLQKYDIAQYIDVIVGGDDVEMPKPEAEGLLKAIAAVRTSKRRTLYIGDNITDALTARNAGVEFVALTTGRTSLDEFNQYQYLKVLSSVDQLVK